MQRCSHSLSTASALRSIFFPTSNQTYILTFLAPSYAVDSPTTLSRQSSQRHYSTPSSSTYGASSYRPPSSSQRTESFSGAARSNRQAPRTPRPVSAAYAAAELRQFGAQQQRRPKDEEIQAREVRLVGGLTGTEKGHELVSPAAVLRKLDRDTHCLVQVGEEGGGADDDGWGVEVVCRVMTRKQYFEYEQRKGKQQASKPMKTAKQLELGWGIGPNDLEHRLKKATEFLASGKKLEILLAPKRRAKKTTPDECAALVRDIKEKILSLGHKEGKEASGKMGQSFTLYFEPKEKA